MSTILINDESFINKVNKTVSNLPNYLFKQLKEFVKTDIDIDKIEKTERKLNVIEKVKNLYNKGIKNVNDILSRIYPKKEGVISSLLIIVVFLIVLALVLLSLKYLFKIIDKYGFKGIVLALLLTIPLGFGAVFTYKMGKIGSYYVEYKITGYNKHVVVTEDENGEKHVAVYGDEDRAATVTATKKGHFDRDGDNAYKTE